jgi:hypothetical protein
VSSSPPSSAGALDLGNVLKGGQFAPKAATPSDSDLKELTDRACVEMHAKAHRQEVNPD